MCVHARRHEVGPVARLLHKQAPSCSHRPLFASNHRSEMVFHAPPNRVGAGRLHASCTQLATCRGGSEHGCRWVNQLRCGARDSVNPCCKTQQGRPPSRSCAVVSLVCVCVCVVSCADVCVRASSPVCCGYCQQPFLCNMTLPEGQAGCRVHTPHARKQRLSILDKGALALCCLPAKRSCAELQPNRCSPPPWVGTSPQTRLPRTRP